MEPQSTQSSGPSEQLQAVGPAGAYAQALLELATEQRPGRRGRPGTPVPRPGRPATWRTCRPSWPAPSSPWTASAKCSATAWPASYPLASSSSRPAPPRRSALLQAVTDQYRGLLQSRNRQVAVLVESAAALDASVRGDLEAVLQRELGMTPILQVARPRTAGRPSPDGPRSRSRRVRVRPAPAIERHAHSGRPANGRRDVRNRRAGHRGTEDTEGRGGNG